MKLYERMLQSRVCAAGFRRGCDECTTDQEAYTFGSYASRALGIDVDRDRLEAVIGAAIRSRFVSRGNNDANRGERIVSNAPACSLFSRQEARPDAFVPCGNASNP